MEYMIKKLRESGTLKKVIVINGKGASGKDTLCGEAAKVFSVLNVSSINPIKRIASMNGWDGNKDDKGRRLLSDLKEAFTRYNDMPNQYLVELHKCFLNSPHEIMFVHIREPEEIEKFKNSIGGKCSTLLVYGRNDEKSFGNKSDDNVSDYPYDFKFSNHMDIEESAKSFIDLIKNIN